jgi:hypothetical protein
MDEGQPCDLCGTLMRGRLDNGGAVLYVSRGGVRNRNGLARNPPKPSRHTHSCAGIALIPRHLFGSGRMDGRPWAYPTIVASSRALPPDTCICDLGCDGQIAVKKIDVLGQSSWG